MRKKFFLTFLYLLTTTVMSFAESTLVDGIYYETIDATTAKVVSSNGEMYSGAITIPSLVEISGESYTVTTIARRAFYNCEGVTSINLPNTITFIDVDAFRNTGITTFTFPTSLTDLSGGVFYASKIKSIVIPSTIESIGSAAFKNCVDLESITISKSVETLGNSVFEGCTSLEEVKLLGAKTMGNFVFLDCSNLVNVELSSKLTSMGDGTFKNCGRLQSIVCKAITAPTYENTLTYDCTSLSTIYIPKGSLESYRNVWGDQYNYEEKDPIFYEKISANTAKVIAPTDDTKYEKELTIPSSTIIGGVNCKVIAIDEGAFLDCTELTSITLPSTITSIGKNAFKNSGITSINIPEGITEITAGLFYGSKITSITIPSSVTKIGQAAFKNCKYLTSITVPANVKVIESSVFEGCSALEEAVLLGVEEMGNYTFTSCSNLKDVELPSTLNSFGDGTFNYCEKLETIRCYATEAPSHGNHISYGCYNIDAVYIPAGSLESYKSVWGTGYNYIEMGGTTPIENTYIESKSKIRKTIKNGRIVIIRDNETYDLSGRLL